MSDTTPTPKIIYNGYYYPFGVKLNYPNPFGNCTNLYCNGVKISRYSYTEVKGGGTWDRIKKYARYYLYTQYELPPDDDEEEDDD